jgi:hypothetical protein
MMSAGDELAGIARRLHQVEHVLADAQGARADAARQGPRDPRALAELAQRSSRARL